MGKLTFYIHSSNLTHWTPAAVECYNRHCICNGCSIFPEQYIKECYMKSYVLGLVKKYGKPKGAENG